MELTIYMKQSINVCLHTDLLSKKLKGNLSCSKKLRLNTDRKQTLPGKDLGAAMFTSHPAE